jgi:predicted transcriptional regulator
MLSMAQAVEQEMQKYFTQLNEEEKKSVVQMIKTFLRGRNPHSSAISIEQYNNEIDEAMSNAEAGNFTTHEDLEQEMKEW